MSGETALIVGASSDIGLALIQRLPPDVRVVAHYHSSARLPPGVNASACDLSSLDAVTTWAASLDAPDYFVYLPGLKLRYERFSTFEFAHFNRDFTIQVSAAVVILKRLAPLMAAKPRARIVFVTSSVTRGQPPRFLSMYAVVKQAQLGLVRALSAEYAGTALGVNWVSPSMVDTRFLDDIPELIKDKARPLIAPGEVADAIASLLKGSEHGVEVALG